MSVRTARKAMYGTEDGNTVDRRPIAAQTAALRAAPAPDDSFEDMFDLAPVSLWLEDYSGVKDLFEQWRAEGMTDLRTHLRERPVRMAECTSRIRVVKVNRRTLELYGADNVDHLVANLPRVSRGDLFDQHVDELVGLWEGRTRFRTATVNYTLSGKRLDILLDGRVLPGHERTWARVLVAVEDETEIVRANLDVARSERYARGLFEHSSVSMWVQDYSAVKARIAELRAQGITDFRAFLDVHPEFVTRCMHEVRVTDVNPQTLRMFAAQDKASLLARLDEVFGAGRCAQFAEQLVDLWDGKLLQRREVVHYTLTGDPVNVDLQFAVLPGYEDTWEVVLVSLTDITMRR